jgi:hypothetical protein
VINAKLNNKLYITDTLDTAEIEFLSLYFKDTMCIRSEIKHTTFLPMIYKELETVTIPRIKVVQAYRKFINKHKELNRINSIILESFWRDNPPWEITIDKEDVDKVELLKTLKEKGYFVSIVCEDELSYDLKIEI